MSWAQLQISGPLTSSVSGAGELRALCGSVPPATTLVLGYPGGDPSMSDAPPGGCLVAVHAVEETIKVLDVDRRVVRTVDRDALRRAGLPLACSAGLLAEAALDGLSPDDVLDRVLRLSTSVAVLPDA